MSSPRWDRLAADLHAAGHVVQVDHLPAAEASPDGEPAYSMTIAVPCGTVEIRDAWHSAAPRLWIGWRARLVGPDLEHGAPGGVIRSMWPLTLRDRVVAFVTECAQLPAPAVAR